MAAAWNDLPATGGLHECAALVGSAEALRVSAPELSVQLARRALMVGATDPSAGTTNAGEARNLSMRAKALLASGLVRISQHAKAVEPGFAALALAEAGGAPDVAAEVRIDLAACAQQVGEPLLGGALLRPVLESVQTPPSVRAAALGRLVGCVAHVSRRDDIEDALAEADRLLAADDGISPDERRMERARLAVRSAAYHRWYGDTEDAVMAAREGLNLLTRLRNDLRSESDRLRARLTLELVCGLLDEGELREAEAAAHPTVDEPVRATSAASVGRLMLALATRVYVPSGQMDRGRHLLDQAAWMAERHALDGLRADTLTEVSRIEEQAGRAGDALEALRAARAAEHRRMRAMSRAARHVLVEVGADHGIRDTTQQSVAALVRQLAHPVGLPGAVTPPQVEPSPPEATAAPQNPPVPGEIVGTVDLDEATRLLDREALFRRLRAVRRGERPVALTLVRVEQNQDGDEDRGPDTGIMTGLADKVRDMAPDNAELARSDGGELAVLLPATTRDQAEEFAATIRETAIESDWAGASGTDMSISTGVVQTDQATTDAAGMLTAARGALTPAQATATSGSLADSLTDTAAALHSALSEDTPTRPLTTSRPPAEPDQAGRSILSSLSIPSGSGGRRRAGGEEPPDATSRTPGEPAEAPRWTRAERRAQQESSWPTDPTPTPPAGWPVPAEEPSRGKRAATPTKPSFGETRTGETTTAINRTTLPTSRPEEPASPGTGESPSRPDEPGLTTRRTIPAPAAPPPGSDAARSASTHSAQPTSGNGPVDKSGRHSTPVDDQRSPATTASGRATTSAAQEPRGDTASRSGEAATPAAQESPVNTASAASSPLNEPVAPDIAARRASAPGSSAEPVGSAESSDAADSGEPSAPAQAAARADSGSEPAAGGAGESQGAAVPGAAGPGTAVNGDDTQAGDVPGLPSRREAPAPGAWGDGGLAGSSSGGILRGPGSASERSSYEETKAELAKMMTTLNARSLAAREGARNGVRQTVPSPPTPDEVPQPPPVPDVPEPPAQPPPEAAEPGPVMPEPPEPPEPGRSGLMAAFDALTGPVPGIRDLRAEFDNAPELPARRPAQSWAELQSAAVVESPAEKLFGTGAGEKRRFRSSLGAAFAEFGETEKKVTEPVKEPVQDVTYDAPIGPEPQPDEPPRRGERSSATIASLLTEALAAYQSTTEDTVDTEERRAPERYDSVVGGDDGDRLQSGVRGRHRSPE